MKHTLLTTALTASILFGMTGCGDNQAKEKNAEKVTQSVPKRTMAERKSAFEKKLQALQASGFDINQTTPGEYLLTVKNEKLAAATLLKMLNMNTLDNQEREPFEEMLKSAQANVVVDWEKYHANQPESVIVYYLGNGSEPHYLSAFFKEKKLAAALSYDGEDRLKAVKVKDIDETIKADDADVHIVLKGMHAKINKAPTQTSKASNYDLFGGDFTYTVTDTENNSSFSLSYKDPVCHTDKSNAYLGTIECKFPTIALELGFDTDLKQEGLIRATINDTSFSSNTTAKNKKVRSDMTFSTASVNAQLQDADENASMQIKHISASGYIDNMDETLMKSYLNLLENPPKENNETIIKMMSFIGKMYSGGMTFDYTVGIDTVTGTSDEGSFALDTYQGEGKGSLDDAINYHEQSTVKHLSLMEKGKKEPLFEINNFRLGYGISDLYNFIPEFMEFSGAIAAQDPTQANPAAINADMEKKLTQMGTNLVHHGFGFSLAPIGWDSLKAEAKGQALSLGKLDFNIDAKLKKNDIPLDMNNPMTAMMLIPFMQANGKLVLKKDDLEKLSQTIPPQILMMVMMYAKYENDNAVFVLKFENGHLLINGKPVM